MGRTLARCRDKVQSIHFHRESGLDIAATKFDYWSDSQIVVFVPYADKIQSYTGQAYVTTASGRSQLVPFQFNPQIQYVELDIKGIEGPVIQAPGTFDECYVMTGPNTTALADPVSARKKDRYPIQPRIFGAPFRDT